MANIGVGITVVTFLTLTVFLGVEPPRSIPTAIVCGTDDRAVLCRRMLHPSIIHPNIIPLAIAPPSRHTCNEPFLPFPAPTKKFAQAAGARCSRSW